MAATGINIEHVVEIDTQVEATIPRSEFGTGLMLTQNSTLDGGGGNKCRRFDDAASVATYFGSTSNVARDAQVWFSADPRPKALYIGRWAKDAVNTTVETGTITTAVTTFEAVTNGSLQVGDVQVSGISFDTDTDYDAVGASLQTALQAALPGTPTVTYANNQFVINFASTADSFTISRPVDNDGNTVGRYVGGPDFLNITNSDGTSLSAGKYRPGTDAETLAQSVARCVALADSGAPVALMLGRDVDTQESDTVTSKSAMRAVAQSGDYMFGMIDTSDSAKASLDTTSEMYLANQASQSKTVAVYADDVTKRSDIAILAKLSAQDFDQPRSIITLVPKELRGVETSAVTSNELNAVLGKNGSVLTRVDGRPTLLGGRTSNGSWADSQWWITWLKNEMETSIFNGLRNSNRFNAAALTDVINSVMAKAVRSGGARPGGVVSESIKQDIIAVTGNSAFDGVLNAGYILWVDNPNTQTTVDRGNRVSRFRIWISPSDAIQSVEGTIILAGG